MMKAIEKVMCILHNLTFTNNLLKAFHYKKDFEKKIDKNNKFKILESRFALSRIVLGYSDLKTTFFSFLPKIDLNRLICYN